MRWFARCVIPLWIVALVISACVTPTPLPTPIPPTATPTATFTLAPPTATATATPTATPVLPTATPTSTPVPPSPTPTFTPPPLVLTPPPFYEDVSHPVALIASYYNAINLKEYARAYSYWQNPPKPYEAFAAGFADTAAARVIVGPPAVPASDLAPVGVPILLFAWHTDGSEYLFYGCFYVSQSPPDVSPPVWQLYDATLQVAPSADVNLLQNACDPLASILYLPKWDHGAQPVDVIFSYYNAIVNEDYERAYNYWEFPTQSYSEFVDGFADTASAFVALIPPEFIEGAVGSQYAAVPTFIVATHHDGTQPTFVGCFITRRPNPDMVGEERPWRIYNATAQPVPDNSTDGRYLLDLPNPCP